MNLGMRHSVRKERAGRRVALLPTGGRNDGEVWHLDMTERGLIPSVMAVEMDTSRAQLNRVLDPEEFNVTLETLSRAARVVGRGLKVDLVWEFGASKMARAPRSQRHSECKLGRCAT